jgi:uncharacterized membrane protein
MKQLRACFLIFALTVAFVIRLATGAYAAAHYNFTPLEGTLPRGINVHSQIVGAYFVPGFDFLLSGFLYDRGEFTRIAPIVGGTEAFSEALGINAKGQTVGYYWGEDQAHGFIYEDGIFTTVDVPFEGATDTTINGINDRGDMVGTYIDCGFCPVIGNIRGFLYSKGEFTRIDPPCDQLLSVAPSGINNRGEVVGYYWLLDQQNRGFTYYRGEYSKIPEFDENTQYMFALGINNQGQIVGYNVPTFGRITGFLYDKGVFVPIQVPGARGEKLWGINSRGEIVGIYADNVNNDQGFLAVPHKGTRAGER